MGAPLTEEQLALRAEQAQQRAADLEVMLDQQLKMIRTLQAQVNREMLKAEVATGSFADKQTVAKMTAITSMLQGAAKTKIDLAKAYEKLDQVMSPEKRAEGIRNFILAMPTDKRKNFLAALDTALNAQKKLIHRNAAQGPSTALSKIKAALAAEEGDDGSQ